MNRKQVLLVFTQFIPLPPVTETVSPRAKS
jgi:hypothetical protein